MKEIFLIIGAPGSGKTTDASLIAQNSDEFSHYSTGDLLRAEVASGSELGKEINSFISKGNLVPLEIVINTIITAFKQSEKNKILLDGYPRSLDQMNELDRVLKKQNELKIKAVIEVCVSEETAKNRVLGRARGDDDSAEVFYNRMKVFNEPIEQIRDFYKKQNLYYQISAEGQIEQIVSEMKELILNLKG